MSDGYSFHNFYALQPKQSGIILKVEKGMHKTPVRYGSTLMLQHVNSGLFLTVRHTAAAFDPECE